MIYIISNFAKISIKHFCSQLDYFFQKPGTCMLAVEHTWYQMHEQLFICPLKNTKHTMQKTQEGGKLYR